MKRFKNWILKRYFIYKLRRFERQMVSLFKSGNVRELRDLANRLRRMPQSGGWEGFHELADTIDQNAEKIVLRRIGI